MKSTIQKLLFATLLGGAALASAGCCGKANKSATTACARSTNSTSCQACCKAATGKTSYMYSSGSGCKCY
jgi:hypothetical protein